LGRGGLELSSPGFQKSYREWSIRLEREDEIKKTGGKGGGKIISRG